jgi:hypothetical protein
MRKRRLGTVFTYQIHPISRVCVCVCVCVRASVCSFVFEYVYIFLCILYVPRLPIPTGREEVGLCIITTSFIISHVSYNGIKYLISYLHCTLPPPQVPIWVSWAQYLCGLSYGIKLAFIIEFNSSLDSCQSGQAKINCENLVNGDQQRMWWVWVLCMVGLCLVSRTVAAWILVQQTKSGHESVIGSEHRSKKDRADST